MSILFTEKAKHGRSILDSGRSAVRRRLLALESLESRELLTSIEWTAGPTLAAPRSDAAALLSGNTVLLLGGGTKSVQRLATNATGWTAAPDTPTQFSELGAVVSSAGILVYGGGDGNEATDEAFVYDSSLGDSQDVAQMNATRLDFAFAADDLGNAYAIGGLNPNENATLLATVERYDATADQWDEVADLPNGLRGASAIGDGSGNIFVFGGSASADSSTVVSDSYRYDVDADQWQPVASLPTAVRDAAAVLDDDGLIYVLGGYSMAGPTDVVQVYDPAGNSWSANTSLPEPLYAHSAALTANSRIVIAGGNNAASNPTPNVYLSQRLDLPDIAPTISSNPVTIGAADQFYAYDVQATGNPEPAFSLTVAPDGMSIDSQTGLISWQPLDSQVGSQPVTVQAANRAGVAEQSFIVSVLPDTTRPTAPTNLQATGFSTTTIDLSWDASTDNKGVDHYAVYQGSRCGWRGRNTCYGVLKNDIPTTQTTITDLTPLTSHKLIVRAFDAAGNVSSNSNQVIATTLGAPTLRYSPVAGARSPANASANFLFSIRLSATGNPTPVFDTVTVPTGMTLDPDTGIVEWLPGPADVGTVTATFSASNLVGTSVLDVPITVTADVPVLSFQFNPNTGGAYYAVAGVPFELQVIDSSNTPSTFELVSKPTGMEIDQDTGLIQWLPGSSDAGTPLVTVKATNAAGVTERSQAITTYFTGSPTAIQVSGLTALHPTANWTPPQGAGADQITGYTVLATRRYRWGRTMRTESFTFDSPETNIEMPGLTEGKSYTLYVTAYDSNGNRGLRSSEVVTFVPLPSIPRLSWQVQGLNGGPIIANQQMTVQLTDALAASDPSTFSIVDAPLEFTLDANTGLGTWIPGAADIGVRTITLRATNSVGSRDAVIQLNVLFSGGVSNATAIRNGNSAFVSWNPPSDNAVPIANYRITRHWTWSSRRRTVSFTIDGTSNSVTVGLFPTGAVSHRGVTITPIDAEGNLGVSVYVPFT